MKRLGCFFLIVLILSASLSGCQAKAQEDSIRQLQAPFSFPIEGEASGVAFRAHIFADAPRESEGGRFCRLGIAFSSPNALSGMTAICENFNLDTCEAGNVSVTLGDMSIDTSALEGLLAPVHLLATAAEHASVTTKKTGGTTVAFVSSPLCTVTLIDGRIACLEGQMGSVYVDWNRLS